MPERRFPLLIAHRGGSPEHVDNSWEAFELATQLGSDLIELDVRLSADMQLIVFHDDTIFGVPPSQLTAIELKALVPTLMTLDEVLDNLDRHAPNMRMVIDLKGRTIERQIAPVILAHNLIGRVLITSKHLPSLWRLKRCIPAVRLGLSRGSSLSARLPGWFRTPYTAILRFVVWIIAGTVMRWAGISTLAANYRLLNPAYIRRLHGLGIRVDAWTVDDLPAARSLVTGNVDYITTNRLSDLLGELSQEPSGGDA